jgi:hypothetical protein
MVSADADFTLGEVALHLGPAAVEVGRAVAAGGEQDGEREVVADQVEDPVGVLAVQDREPGRQEGGAGLRGVGLGSSGLGSAGLCRHGRSTRSKSVVKKDW